MSPTWTADDTQVAVSFSRREAVGFRWWVAAAQVGDPQALWQKPLPGWRASQVSWAPDGRTVAIVVSFLEPSARYELQLMSPANEADDTHWAVPHEAHAERGLLVDGDGAVAWSPDGKRVAVGVGSILTVLDPAAAAWGEVTSVAPDGLAVDDVQWAPNGRWAYVHASDESHEWSVLVSAVDGEMKAPSPVRFPDEHGVVEAAWIPGTSVLLAVAVKDTTNAMQRITDLGGVFGPCPSLSRERDRYRAWLLDVDSGRAVLLDVPEVLRPYAGAWRSQMPLVLEALARWRS